MPIRSVAAIVPHCLLSVLTDKLSPYPYITGARSANAFPVGKNTKDADNPNINRVVTFENTFEKDLLNLELFSVQVVIFVLYNLIQ